MKLLFSFEDKGEAFSFYGTTKAIHTGEESNWLLNYLKDVDINLSELQVGCYICSIYQISCRWIVYFEFDDEYQKIGTSVYDALVGLCQEIDIQLTDSQVDYKKAFNEVDRMKWPESEPKEYTIEDSSPHTYELTISLPPENTDSKEEHYDAQYLNKQQQVECASYWNQGAGISYDDMEMVVTNLQSDGIDIGRDIERIANCLHGHGEFYAHGIYLGTYTQQGLTLKLHMEQLIVEIVGAVVGVNNLANNSYSHRGIGIRLISDMGVSIIFSTKAPQFDHLQLIEQFKETYVFKFIDRMYDNLFQKRPVLILSSDSVERKYQEAEEEEVKLYTLTEALKLAGSTLSAVKANKLLVKQGILKEVKLRGVKTPRKIFADNESVYGINFMKSDRKNDYEARYYIEPFQSLLDLYIK